MDIQKEQNSFKKTMLDQHGEYDEEHFELDSYGNFSWIGTDDHFEIWMLCAKAKQAEIDELKGKLAKAQAVPKWISVEEALPPGNILVLAMAQTFSNVFNVYNVMALDEFQESDITHWMPLPDAPQEPTND